MKKQISGLAAAVMIMAFLAVAPASQAGGLDSLLSNLPNLGGLAGGLGALTEGGGDIGSLTSILMDDPAFLQEAMKIFPELLNKAKSKFNPEEQQIISKALEEVMGGAGMMAAASMLSTVVPQVKAIAEALKTKDQSVLVPGGPVDQVLEKLKSSNLVKLPDSIKDRFFVAVREAAGEALGVAPAASTGTTTSSGTTTSGQTTGGTVTTGTGTSATSGGAIPGLDTSTLGGGTAVNPATGSQITAGTSGTATTTGTVVVSGTGAQVGTAGSSGVTGTVTAASAAEAAAVALAAAKENAVAANLKKIRDKIKLALEKVKVLQKELPKMYPPLRIPGASAAHLNIKNVAMLLRARYRAAGNR